MQCRIDEVEVVVEEYVLSLMDKLALAIECSRSLDKRDHIGLFGALVSCQLGIPPLMLWQMCETIVDFHALVRPIGGRTRGESPCTLRS